MHTKRIKKYLFDCFWNIIKMVDQMMKSERKVPIQKQNQRP